MGEPFFLLDHEQAHTCSSGCTRSFLSLNLMPSVSETAHAATTPDTELNSINAEPRNFLGGCSSRLWPDGAPRFITPRRLRT